MENNKKYVALLVDKHNLDDKYWAKSFENETLQEFEIRMIASFGRSNYSCEIITIGDWDFLPL